MLLACATSSTRSCKSLLLFVATYMLFAQVNSMRMDWGTGYTTLRWLKEAHATAHVESLDKLDTLEGIDELEDLCETDRLAASPMLDGWWKCLYCSNPPRAVPRAGRGMLHGIESAPPSPGSCSSAASFCPSESRNALGWTRDSRPTARSFALPKDK